MQKMLTPEIRAKLAGPQIDIRQDVLKYCLSHFSALERIALCADFRVDRMSGDGFTLHDWTDAMITLFFHSCSEYVWGLICSHRQDNPTRDELANSDIYDLVDDISGVFEDDKLFSEHLFETGAPLENISGSLKDVLLSLHYDMSLAPYDGQAVPQIKCRNETMYFVNCLIEDSSCLQTILAQYMIVFVQCTFLDLNCTYLKPTHNGLADDNDFFLYWEGCSIQSVLNLGDLDQAIVIGFDFCTIQHPVLIPTPEKGWSRNQMLSLVSHMSIDPKSSRKKYCSLGLASGPDELRWLMNAEIQELVCDWTMLLRLLEQTKGAEPTIHQLVVVGSNTKIAPFPDLIFDLSADISIFGIQSLIHLAPRIEDSAETHLKMLQMYNRFPKLHYVHFPFVKDSLGGVSLQHGVWVENKVPQVCSNRTDAIVFPCPSGWMSGTWHCLGENNVNLYHLLQTGLSLDIMASRKVLGLD